MCDDIVDAPFHRLSRDHLSILDALREDAKAIVTVVI